MRNSDVVFLSLIFILFLLLLLYWRIRRKRLKAYISDILGLIEVWEKYNGEKVLTINKYTHGISIEDTSIVKSYWYSIAQEALHHVGNKKNPEVLFLGLGANASSRIIYKENPRVHQTIIEIDNFIIQACREYFHLDEMKNMTLIRGDAYRLVDTRHDFKNTFDVIVVDIFTGIPPYVSTKTNQPPFIQKMLQWSKKNGRIIFNRPANIKKDRADTKKLFAYLKTLFQDVKKVYIQDPRGYQNDILTATMMK